MDLFSWCSSRVTDSVHFSSDERLYKSPEGPAGRQRRRPSECPQVGYFGFLCWFVTIRLSLDPSISLKNTFNSFWLWKVVWVNVAFSDVFHFLKESVSAWIFFLFDTDIVVRETLVLYRTVTKVTSSMSTGFIKDKMRWGCLVLMDADRTANIHFNMCLSSDSPQNTWTMSPLRRTSERCSSSLFFFYI